MVAAVQVLAPHNSPRSCFRQVQPFARYQCVVPGSIIAQRGPRPQSITPAHRARRASYLCSSRDGTLHQPYQYRPNTRLQAPLLRTRRLTEPIHASATLSGHAARSTTPVVARGVKPTQGPNVPRLLRGTHLQPRPGRSLSPGNDTRRLSLAEELTRRYGVVSNKDPVVKSLFEDVNIKMRSSRQSRTSQCLRPAPELLVDDVYLRDPTEDRVDAMMDLQQDFDAADGRLRWPGLTGPCIWDDLAAEADRPRMRRRNSEYGASAKATCLDSCRAPRSRRHSDGGAFANPPTPEDLMAAEARKVDRALDRIKPLTVPGSLRFAERNLAGGQTQPGTHQQDGGSGMRGAGGGLRKGGGRAVLGDRTNIMAQQAQAGIKTMKKMDDLGSAFAETRRLLRTKAGSLKDQLDGVALPADCFFDEASKAPGPATKARAVEREHRCIVRTLEDEASELVGEPPRPEEPHVEEHAPAEIHPEDVILAGPSLLEQLQDEDRLKCRLERQIHIKVPPGVGPDRKVRVVMSNMIIELLIPEGAVEGEVVACDPPLHEPMSRAAQRDLLLGSVQMRLRWQPSPDGSTQFFDDGADGRCRAKLERFRAMRGRCMGRVLPHLSEEDGEL